MSAPAVAAGLTIRPEVVETWIARFAALTEPDSGLGVTRLAYSRLERRAHSLFSDHARRLGLSVSTDEAGNTVAERAGSEPGLPALGTGSHLDSVPNGGAFDGIAGVVAGMAVAEELVAQDVTHRHPIRFVAFAAEEGARFGQACTGSRIVAGLTTTADLHRLVDTEGISVAAAMDRVGLPAAAVAAARWSPRDWAAFVELHIEQGAVLDTLGIPIGVVDLISGSTRLAVTLRGRAAHTGGTPMHLRHDALVAAAQVVLLGEQLARDSRHHGTRITVGRLDVAPGSLTTIPGECRLYIDIRDVDSCRQRETAEELLAEIGSIASVRGIEVEWELLADASPVLLPRSVQTALLNACQDRGLDYRIMASGASHDSQMVNRVCPVGMVFVPSLNHGVSHCPDELSTTEALVRGTEVVAHALLGLDTRLHPATDPRTES